VSFLFLFRKSNEIIPSKIALQADFRKISEKVQEKFRKQKDTNSFL